MTSYRLSAIISQLSAIPKKMDPQLIIVLLIIVAAAAYAVINVYRQTKSECGKDCGCGSARPNFLQKFFRNS